MSLTQQQHGFGSTTREGVSSGKGIAAWIERWLVRLTHRGIRQQCLRHVETLSLGAKRSVVLIECDGQRFLIAEGMSAPVALAQGRVREEQR